MKLESATVVIEPRPISACVDLALVFCRRHARGLLPPTLFFAVVGALLAYLFTTHTEAGLVWSAVWFWLVSPALAALLVTGAGHAVFGARCEPLQALRSTGRARWTYLLWIVPSQLLTAAAGFICFGISSLPVGLYLGFLPEVILLERVRSGDVRRRINDLVRGSYAFLLGRAVVLLVFGVALVASIFVLVDEASAVLFDWPLFWGRVDRADIAASALDLLTGDPIAVSLLSAIVWLVYPLARLAWFFCYLDTRTRKEAWDLELDFRVEAQRLEAVV